MAGKLFDRLEREAFRGGIQARTKESMRWFRTRVSQIKGVNRNQLMKDARNRKRFIYGDMYMYMYVCIYLFIDIHRKRKFDDDDASPWCISMMHHHHA